jgi:two-component system, NarL family, nitrate/nitrite response regulator NarL
VEGVETSIPGNPIAVIVADDHPVVRVGIRHILKDAPGISLVGEAKDGQEALELTRKLKPDVLLLDMVMPRLVGLDVLRELALFNDSPRVLLLTAVLDKQQLLQALELGVRGVLLKDSAAEDVVQAIGVVMQGQYWLGREAVSNLVLVLRGLVEDAKQPAQPRFNITGRESQIIKAIVSGYTNKDIANELSISEETVKRHLTNVFDKLGVSNRLELALFAIHHHLTTTTV